jgi:hypothetical protein
MKRYVIKRVKDGKYWHQPTLRYRKGIDKATVYDILPHCLTFEIAVEVEVEITEKQSTRKG